MIDRGDGAPGEASSWHGTFVSGIIAANSNNGVGIAGLNWAAKILPVRVLGKCGGTFEDITAGVMWVGLLYYFNFVNAAAAKAAAEDGTAAGNDLSGIDLGKAGDPGRNQLQAALGSGPDLAGLCIGMAAGQGALTLAAEGNVFSGPTDCSSSNAMSASWRSSGMHCERSRIRFAVIRRGASGRRVRSSTGLARCASACTSPRAFTATYATCL